MASKSLASKKGALAVKKDLMGEQTKDNSLAKEFFSQVNCFHDLDNWYNNYEIEQLLVQQKEHDLLMLKKKVSYDRSLCRFNPSGASKCARELFFKITNVEGDNSEYYPYHKRWTRNAEAVHEATQRDLLYMEKMLDNPAFTVARVHEVLGDVEEERKNLPAWEKNLLSWKKFTHKGEHFLLNGMMDGVLKHQPDGKLIGFEFKTKSTTIATVGTFKMKDVQDSHRQQCVSYSCLFFGDVYEDRTDSFIVMYESLAKDGWTKGAEARDDFRTFQVEVTLEDRMELLDKFAEVAKMVRENQLPEMEEDKCFFCPYKAICKGE